MANGPHTLGWKAIDSLGNAATTSFNVTVTHAPPSAPVLTQPATGSTVGNASLAIAGTAQAGSNVQLVLNGQAVGTAITIGLDGRFSTTASLTQGSNQVQATASDNYGTGPASNPVQVTLDDSIPARPGNLVATAQAGGKVRLSWGVSTDQKATGYDLYRSGSAFENISVATKANASVLKTNAFDDLPAQDGAWSYRVVAVNAVGTPSLPSNLAQAVSDNTLPRATRISYAPQGSYDPDTGLIGQGQVNVQLTVSEELASTPYLSIVPLGGTPVPVALTQAGANTYTGQFNVTSSTPPGPANALFSARDVAGNRGTDIDSGATLKFDTAGPSLSGIALDPPSPINNNPGKTVKATFTFTKPPKSPPLVNVQLSGTGRTPIPLAELSKEDGITWVGSFDLPENAGASRPESMAFDFKAIDALNNESTKVLASNQFQVYQGDLPPLEVPFALTAKAQPKGKVKLNWQAVENANGYQLYRQAPGQTELLALERPTGTEYIDQTPQDGSYTYAIASIRQANDQEAVSGQSPSVTVTASATAPGEPKNLALRLSGQGIVAAWQAPVQGTVDSYNLYRSTGTSITNIEGLEPLKTGIKQLAAVDATPSRTEGGYAVTAVDAAGNESALSNSVYLNASLLPVSRLKVEQIASKPPKLSWVAPNGNVTAYKVYADAGPNLSKIPLTADPINQLNYVDVGYNGGSRQYTVATVDANDVEMSRSLLLPSVTVAIANGLPIQRGIMNQLQVQVSNQSNKTLENVRAAVKLPTDKASTLAKYKHHYSQPLTIEAGQSRLIPVVVGGYEGLPDSALAQVRVEIAPNEGELVSIAKDQEVEVTEGSLVVGMSTSDFTRGATGKLKLTIENTTETEIELLTATQNGQTESTDLRFEIVDSDDNVLATQPYKQAIGANVVSLPSGQTVARIPAGTSYFSDEFLLNIPAASPTDIKVRLLVDKLRYHTGQADEVVVTGKCSEKSISLVDTAYYGEATGATPESSSGNQNITIAGRALDRKTNSPLPNTPLKLVLNQQGFERVFSVTTNAEGNFIYTFTPTLTDSGLYKVSVVHPEVSDRPEQKTFTINRVNVTPNLISLDVPKNYPSTIPFTAKAGPGSVATNLRLTYDAASQVTGLLPEGINVQLPPPVNLNNRQTVDLPVIFTASNDAALSGSLIFNIVTDEHQGKPVGQLKVDYKLSEAKPFLVSTPNAVQTGLKSGDSQIETLKLENKGLKEATNLEIKLLKADGSAAPTWASIVSQPFTALAVGAQESIDLMFNPPEGATQGVYNFKLQIKGDDLTTQSVNVYASLTQSGEGNALFKVSDIYTATKDKAGNVIQGLKNASITLQNEDVFTVNQELVTDNVGEALFQGLPAGFYKFRAKGAGHQEIGGRLQIKPGITVNQPVFLPYNLISVEWSVREITIQDRYEITLNATFETDVPAPVVVIEPTSINLPKMKVGEVFYGELNVINYGLVRADKITQQLPGNDSYFRFEFLSDMPTSLLAKQRVTIPYRVIALQDLEAAASAGTASGGGCHSVSYTFATPYKYECANGVESSGSASATWFSSSNSTCPTGTGSYSPYTIRRYVNNLGGPWDVGGIASGGGGYLGGQPRCAKCPKCQKNK